MAFHNQSHPRLAHRVVAKKSITPVLAVAASTPVVKHVAFHRPVTLRECPPVLPLAELGSESLAQLFVPNAPGGLSSDAGASTPSIGPAPAEASGTDLPVPTLGNIGSTGGAPGGGGAIIGVPPGYGGSGGGGGGGGSKPPPGPPPAVPEPATWALMLIGVGAIGALVRRERRPRPMV